MLDWKVEIRPGTLESLSEQQFLVEAEGTIKDMIADYNAKLIIRKDEHFGLNIPQWMRLPRDVLKDM